MTARAIGVFALVLAMASPAMAGPGNSVIGGKKLESDMVHNGGVGYPSLFYEWWNSGKKNLDWAIIGELVYGDFTAAASGPRIVKIGFGVDGVMRWRLVTKEKSKVTNDVGLLIKPGIMLGGNRADTFTFGVRGEVGAPVSIDIKDRFAIVTGGYVPITWLINGGSAPSIGWIPLLVRLGVEVKTNKNLAPWFYFDLGPGFQINDWGGRSSGARFAWRVGAGTAFWGIRGKDMKGKEVETTREGVGPVLTEEEEPAPEPAEPDKPAE